VLNSDVSVVVTSDGKRLGELTISRGSIDWRRSKPHAAVRLRWEQFNKLMEKWSSGDLS